MDAADDSMAVFKAISELMKDNEFVTANMDFFEKHCHTFDANVEENKHEYKQIFEEFLKVQEDVIEGKLKEKFTEEQILGCYENFQDNLKAYEQQDKETVDFLYEMIDFDKFKARMCNSKAMMLQEEKQEIQKLSNAEMLKSRNDLNVNLELAVFTKLIGESVTSDEHGWKKRLETKDWVHDFKMIVYSKKQEHTKNDLFRMHIKTRKMSCAQMCEIFKNIPVEKFKQTIEEKNIDIQESADKKEWSSIRYRCIGAPMITDRDSVCAFKFLYQDNGHVFMCSRSIEDDRFPEVKNRIRMFVNEQYECYDSEENGVPITVFNGTSTYDVKGYIPVSMLNMSAANNMFKWWQDLMTKF